MTITEVVVQGTGGNNAPGTIRAGIRAPEGPILTWIQELLVASLVRWAPRSASVTGKIVFICAGWTITVPIVEAVDTDSAIAEWASKVDVKTWLLTRIRLNQKLNLRKGTRKVQQAMERGRGWSYFGHVPDHHPCLIMEIYGNI